MKHKQWLAFLFSSALSFCIAYAGAGCIATAFVIKNVDMARIAQICLLFSLFSGLCLLFRWGEVVVLGMLAIAAGFLLRNSFLILQVEALLYHISQYYDTYGWGIIQWSGTPLSNVEVTGALSAIAVIVIFCINWVTSRRKLLPVGVIAGFLPLAACCVVTDTVPDVKYLFLLLFGEILLILTQAVRRKNPADATRLTALLMAPLFGASMLLFYLVPQEGYKPPSLNLQNSLNQFLDSLPFGQEETLPNLRIPYSKTVKETIYLSAVGPRPDARFAVMDVVSDQGGILYLRGQGYENYTGSTWAAPSVSFVDDVFWPNRDLLSAGEVTISTRTLHGLLYAPYHPLDRSFTTSLKRGILENPDDLLTYSFQRVIEGSLAIDPSEFNSSSMLKRCRSLPSTTLVQAQKILVEAFGEDFLSYAESDKAQLIQEYVSSSATYDLNTQKPPASANDFAIWFLNDSPTGYCIHFASAAAVLLRAANVPARYVTGYMVEVEAGVRTVVSEETAHAWVEYLDPDNGWTILEATPSSETPETPQPTTPPVTDPTEVTQPEDTTAPTKPSASQNTDPTKPGEQDPSTPEKPEDPQGDTPWLRPVLTVFGGIFGIVLALWAQYTIRCKIRRKRMRTGSRNQQALCRWRYAGRLEKCAGLEPPADLKDLADKAMFSQHTLTKEELVQFDLWLTEAGTAFRKKPLPYRLLMGLIWAIE